MLVVKIWFKNHRKDEVALMEKWAYAKNLEDLRFQSFNGNVNRLNVWFPAFVLDPQSVVFNLAFVFVSFLYFHVALKISRLKRRIKM